MTDGTAAPEDAVAKGAAADDAAVNSTFGSGFSVKLMAAFADVQRAWELHWSTVIAIDDNERADASSSYTQVKYGATLDKAVREKGKAMAICTEALQQLQEAQRIQHSTKQTDTPVQLMQQHHPAKAMAFRQAAESTEGGPGKHRVKGFVESADEEASKRSGMVEELRKSARSQYEYNRSSSAHQLGRWQCRAQDTSTMAQQLGQAATDAMSALEAACSDQEWDHRTMFKLHDSKLATMETVHGTLQDECQALGQGSECILQRQKSHDKIEAHKVEMRAEEELRSKMQKFMCKVTLMDVTTQFQRSKAKERK
jgi:hypothetical protein